MRRQATRLGARRAPATAMLLLAIAMLSAGCATPVEVEALEEPAMLTIGERFREVVDAAHQDDRLDWFSGWSGNGIVNLIDDDEKLGLCYHWQEWVYSGIKPTAEAVGWAATGVAINNRTQWEHHAVVVFDPERIDEEDLLDARSTDPVYVLDAWRHGKNEVYRMKDWLGIPLLVLTPPVLEEVPFTLPHPPPGEMYMAFPPLPPPPFDEYVEFESE